MAEEFQGGVCGGGSWWNSSRNLFASSPCSSVINDFISWPPNQDLLMDINTTTTTTTLSNDDSAGSNSDNGNMTPFDWNQELVGGRSEEKYSHILQESAPHVLDPSMNYRQQACPQIKDWTSNNFCDNNNNNNNNNSFKQVNHQDFPMESAPLFNYSSLPLLQSLFEDDPQPPQSMTNSLQGMNYSSGPSYPMINSNDFAKPSAKQQPADHLRFTNDTQFWNSKAEALNSFQTSLPLATQLQFVPSSGNNAKPNLSNFVAKRLNEETGSIASVAKKASSETPFKRPRIETPSPLPTFKVRKEKLGDRITALQQLVSPFGKTDTASVLHEAIEYIKFLHDQVNVLSTPYMKNGSPPLQHQQAIDKLNDHEGLKQDLRSRGLCLVPISSTFPVASETTSDFWTPTFGGSFR